MGLEYLVVDAFTGERFSGNPAAVVLDARGLSEARMQAIAAEFNLSETTFILPAEGEGGNASCEVGVASRDAARSGGGIVSEQATGDPSRVWKRFRWFTPNREVTMCGHATIAGVHALIETGEVGGEETGGTLKIQTLGGVLTASVESAPDGGNRMIWLELICPTLGEAATTGAELAGSLGLGANDFDSSLPMVCTQDGDLLAFVDCVATLNRAAPDSRRLGALLDEAGARGLCLATVKTLSPSIGVQLRFFAPSYGVDEDPVTGSVHGPLAAYLVDQGRFPIHDGTAGMMCVQGIPGGRSGVVFVLVERCDDGGRSVRIGGQAVTTMRGMVLHDGP